MKQHISKPVKDELTKTLSTMDVVECSKFYGVSKRTIRRWQDSYGLGATKLGPQKKNIEKTCSVCSGRYMAARPHAKYCSSLCRLQGINREPYRRHDNEVKTIFSSYKKQIGCYLCRYNKCAGALVFHHVKPEDKSKPISSYDFCYKTDHWFVESQKCVLICHNCHSEVHELLRYNKEEYIRLFDRFNRKDSDGNAVDTPGSD